MDYLSKENVQEILGLSPLQESIWHTPISSTTANDIKQRRLTFEGEIDSSQFQRAWDSVVQEHALLRTIFRQVRNRIVQVVLKVRPSAVAFHDLRGQPACEQEQFLQATALELRAGFELATGPLVRLALFRVGENESILLWTHHEIILDDESYRLVLTDLRAAYTALMRDQSPRVQQRRPYQDYLTWLTQQDWTPVRAFWSKELAGFEGLTALKFGNPAPVCTPDTSPSYQITLSKELSQALTGLAAQYDITVGALVQAAWALLLSRYNDSSEVTYGLCCSGRPGQLPGAEDMIGRFAQTLPNRLRVDGNQPLPVFLEAVQEHYDCLMNHAYLPLSEQQTGGISAKIEGQSDNSCRGVPFCGRPDPLFTTHLTVYEPVLTQNHDAALKLVAEESIADAAKYLAIEVISGACWNIVISCPAGMIAADILERLLVHFQTLLESMLRQKEACIGDLEMLPLDEQMFLLQESSQANLAYPLDRLAHQVIEEQVLLHPRKTAAIHGDEQITYEELNRKANQLARWLASQGFGRNDLAGLLAERSVDMLIAILAIFKAGGAYVPLDAAHPDARLQALLQSCNTKVLLTQEHQWQRSLKLVSNLLEPPRVFCLNARTTDGLSAHAGLLEEFSDTNLECVHQPEDLAYVFYTSGSTGIPKGAMITHIGMLNHLGAKIRLLNLSPTSIVVQNASHCFDISVWQFLTPLMVGGTVAIYTDDPVVDPLALLVALQRDRATVLEIVPTMLSMFLQLVGELSPETRMLPELEYLISTGEGLPAPLCRQWLLTYPHTKVVNAYGPTECSDDVTHQVIVVPPPIEQSFIPIGSPISRLKVYILDSRQRLLPAGCIGEIYIAGIGVGQGYLHDVERTQTAFLPNPFCDDPDSIYARMYRTGDVGYLLPDGRAVHLGRLDSQIKVRGYRIELGEIETALLRHPAVKQCVAIARPDHRDQTHILAYVVLTNPTATAELRAFVLELLPEYMVPEHILILDELPMNANQKVDRRALPGITEMQRAEESFVAPRSETEANLATIWNEVLGVTQIGIDDSFFHLGGHSLKLIQLRSRIQQHFAVALDLRIFFECQTIRQLAPMIEQACTASASTITNEYLPSTAVMTDYPLLPAQKRLWYLQQLIPQSCFYTMPVALQLEGPLDALAFEQAFQAIVDRHASLRSAFPIKDGKPVQRISKTWTFHCPCTDLSTLEDEAQRQAVAGLIDADASTSFDLEAGPLFRVQRAILAPERHLLLLNLHHIIGDAWSWQLLQQEFVALYEAFIHHQPNPLPALTLQYEEYVLWQSSRLSEENLHEQLAYWKQQLAGAPQVLELPTDHPRPPVQHHHGASISQPLSPALAQQVYQVSQREGVTPFMLLLSAFAILVSRMSGQQDFLIGTGIAGRTRPELEALIGFFVNTLPLRLQLQGHPSGRHLLQRVREMTMQAYAHQELPFEQIVEALQPPRDLSRNPLLQVFFTLDNTSEALPSLPDLSLTPIGQPTHNSRFDLTLAVTQRGDDLHLLLEYDTDLFAPDSIQHLLSRYALILAGLLTDLEQPVERLPWLLEHEQRHLLTRGNQINQSAPEYHTLLELFAQQVQTRPEAIALSSEQEQLSYGELDRRANQLAHYLQALGIGPDTPVGLYLERSPLLLLALLAILKAGGAYLPLDPAYPSARLQFMLADAQAPVLLTSHALLLQTSLQTQHILCLDQLAQTLAAWPDSPPICDLQPEHLACIIYTSGSTGQPKGVMIPQRAIQRLVLQTDYLQINPTDRITQVSNTSFDAATFEIWGALLNGAQLIVVPKIVTLMPTDLVAFLRRQQITILFLTTALFNQVAQAVPDAFSTLDYVLFGGEAVDPGSVRTVLAHARPTHLLHVYGPTENTTFSTWYPVESVPQEATTVPIGTALAYSQAYILDTALQPVPPGVPGELYVGGDRLARGYLARPALTAERFVPHPFSTRPGARLYRTGDLVRARSDGAIEFLGRIDSQVKIRGFRVELNEIEFHLNQHPAVRDTVVLLREDQPGDKRLVAYAVLAPGASLSNSQMRDFLRVKLPEYMLPSALVILEQLPLTPNGKIDPRQLPKPITTDEARRDSYVAPRDLLELEMTKLWEEVLHTHSIGIDDDFFELGGHSLTAVELVGAIQMRFGVKLPLVEFLQKPTIEHLCSLLRDGTVLSNKCLILLQQGTNPIPIFMVHPQGGGVLCYLHLAKALGREETVYGLQAPGYDSDEPFLRSIEEMVDRYAKEIQRVAPHGPYRLAGWSMGGLLAFEIARRMEAMGEGVDFLGLLDVPAPPREARVHANEQPFVDQNQVLLDLAINYLELERGVITDVNEDEVYDLLLQRAKDLNLIPQEARREFIQHQARIMMVNQSIIDAYWSRAQIQADIHLFCASEYSSDQPVPLVEAEGWQHYTAGKVFVTPVQGNHHTMVRPPFVLTLAEALSAAILQGTTTNIRIPAEV